MLKVISNLIKISSVTFHIKDSYRIAQPKDTARIASELWTWAAENAPRSLTSHRPEPIAIDGFHPDYTGVINWYVPNGVDPNEVPMYIDQFIREEAAPAGIKITYKLDQSKMFNVPVWRLSVIENKTVDRQQLPEMNLANRNAEILLLSLGIIENRGDDLMGQMDAHELLERIGGCRQVHSETPLDLPPTMESGQGPTVYDFGLGASQFSGYLDRLEQLARTAIQMNAPIVEWA